MQQKGEGVDSMKKKITCPKCGSETAAGQQFCGACGTKLGGEVEQQTIVCPSCGSQNAIGQQFCGACGAKLAIEVEQQTIACPNCGAQNPAGQEFCGACGARLAGVTQPVPTRGVSSLASRQQIEVKPTWELAWGLFWRMALLGLFVMGTVYLIAMIVMLALGFTYPIGF